MSSDIRYTPRPVHISQIRIGDVVECHGGLRTVSKGDMKHDPFIGYILWGDSYRCGTVPVIKADVFHAKPKV